MLCPIALCHASWLRGFVSTFVKGAVWSFGRRTILIPFFCCCRSDKEFKAEYYRTPITDEQVTRVCCVGFGLSCTSA